MNEDTKLCIHCRYIVDDSWVSRRHFLLGHAVYQVTPSNNCYHPKAFADMCSVTGRITRLSCLSMRTTTECGTKAVLWESMHEAYIADEEMLQKEREEARASTILETTWAGRVMNYILKRKG